jgi:hypothetical protein
VSFQLCAESAISGLQRHVDLLAGPHEDRPRLRPVPGSVMGASSPMGDGS